MNTGPVTGFSPQPHGPWPGWIAIEAILVVAEEGLRQPVAPLGDVVGDAREHCGSHARHEERLGLGEVGVIKWSDTVNLDGSLLNCGGSLCDKHRPGH